MLRRLALSLLAALLTALLAATALILAWLVVDPVRAQADAPYAWAGLFLVSLAFGLPGTVLFGLAVTPLVARAGRAHPGWAFSLAALGGGALVWLTTNLRFAVLGVLGGVAYAALERRWARRQG